MGLTGAQLTDGLQVVFTLVVLHGRLQALLLKRRQRNQPSLYRVVSDLHHRPTTPPRIWTYLVPKGLPKSIVLGFLGGSMIHNDGVRQVNALPCLVKLAVDRQCDQVPTARGRMMPACANAGTRVMTLPPPLLACDRLTHQLGNDRALVGIGERTYGRSLISTSQ